MSAAAEIPLTEKRRVPDAFDRVARRYDLLTGLNPGYRRHLRMSAERLHLAADAAILDLCCGTGLSTAALRRVYPRATITALDASPGMLEVAAKKPWASEVRWLCGDAMDPAAAGAVGPFDGILMAYGIRNVPDADACLARLLGLLAPGGAICFHEYSVRDSRWARTIWNLVAGGIIIPSGALTSPGSPIYRYLRRSVLDFDGVRAFEARLARAGFTDVHTEPMDGWQRGVVHSFLARRPR
ncbi:MAG: class I SAM-dependent methyltransferase [Myxococcales bacterium]|nr:class I SAM-dependent methyltransferase [Myxococcales bacterium]